MNSWFSHHWERPYLPMVGLAGLSVLVVVRWLWKRNRNKDAISLHSFRTGWFQPIALQLALIMFAVAAAGPRWGKPENIAIASGPDIVAVVDISRSMTARDAMPDRLNRAKENVQQLLQHLARRGGCRVGLVAFASKPLTICPLTFDLGHVAQAVSTISIDTLPDAFAANAVSGTRIGAALIHAAQLPGVNESLQILLLSDGDDPARDGEWRRGLALGIPIHVVGLGNPEADIKIPDIENATSRLQKGPLRELASQTGGNFFTDDNSNLATSGIISQLLKNLPTTDSEAVVSRAPAQPTPILIAGLTCLTLGLTGFRWRPAAAVTTAFVMAASPIDDWLRRGNAELAAGRAEAALTWYAKAAERTPDPGQVAFNQGVALANLGRFREAELHFRRSLSDAEGERRAKALFNLGTCLVRRCSGTERKALSDAVAAFRQALPLADAQLAIEVQTNLSIAEKLLAQAPPELQGKPPTPEPGGESPEKDGRLEGSDPGDNNTVGQPGKSRRPVESKTARKETTAAAPGKGNLPPLPDSESLTPIPPEDVASHLFQIEKRITAAKLERMKAKTLRPNSNYPDW